MNYEYQQIVSDNQISLFLHRLDKIPVMIYVPPFTEWAEENRYIPPGVSPYPGRFTLEIAPHMREILECQHPDSPIHETVIMKSVQSLGTVTIIENAIGAYIKYKLGSILYVTSNKGVGRIRTSANIDVLIDNSGLAEYVKPISNRTGRKNSDTAMYKEFDGGIKFLTTSYASKGDRKSNTFSLLCLDELDEAEDDNEQGDVEEIFAGRTMTIRDYKIIKVSTPSRMETSRIYKNFLEGDQSYYYAECPLCGEKQILVMRGGKNEHGLTFTTQKDQRSGNKVIIPETVRYICEYCRGEFHESKKQQILANGEWRPHAIPIRPDKRSFHISGLMSPEMFLSWERICQQFLASGFGEDLPKFKDFMINYLGNPWSSVESTKGWEEIRDRAEDYAYPIPPAGTFDGETYHGPLIYCAGVDVQGDRLECHVVGFGPGMEKWSVDYRIFYGNPANLDDPCWIALEEFTYSQTYPAGNRQSYIGQIAIDSGFGPSNKRDKDWAGKTHVVYEFVGRHQDRFIAIMGIPEDKSVSILKEARVEGSTLKKRYNVSVGIVKEMVMANLDLTSGPGAIHFPRSRMENGKKIQLPDDHFRQFMSERYQEIAPGKFGWVKIYKRNEVWDTFIYAIAAAYYQNLPGKSAEIWQIYYTHQCLFEPDRPKKITEFIADATDLVRKDAPPRPKVGNG